MPMSTILVIDDDKLVRWSVSMVLGRAGYRIREAATGTDGLAALQHYLPDLILLDISLPDMDGLKVLKAIRDLCPELPVLMITAEPNAETRQQALHLGAAAYLEKPCGAATLLEAVSHGLLATTPMNQGNG